MTCINVFGLSLAGASRAGVQRVAGRAYLMKPS